MKQNKRGNKSGEQARARENRRPHITHDRRHRASRRSALGARARAAVACAPPHPQHLEGSCDGYLRCMDDLCKLVSTIMIERFAFTFLFDNWLPRAMAYKRFRDETKGVDPSKARKRA